MALIFEELHGYFAEVMDAGQHVPGMFLSGFIKAREIQERYLRNEFKYGPALTGILLRGMLVHDGGKHFKAQLEKLKNTKNILFLYSQNLMIIIIRRFYTRIN